MQTAPSTRSTNIWRQGVDPFHHTYNLSSYQTLCIHALLSQQKYGFTCITSSIFCRISHMSTIFLITPSILYYRGWYDQPSNASSLYILGTNFLLILLSIKLHIFSRFSSFVFFFFFFKKFPLFLGYQVTSLKGAGELSRNIAAIASQIQWRQIVRYGVSNHRRLVVHRKKISKLRVHGLCKGNPPLTAGFHSQKASNAENVSIWWRHRD